MPRDDGAPYGRGRRCNVLTVAQAAYIAGIIDGEGTIGITSRKPHKKSKRGTITPHVAVNMSTPMVADWLIEVTGLGSRNKAGGYKRKREEKVCSTYLWTVNAAGAASLLEQVAPYLVLKAINATALLRVHYELLRDPVLIKSDTWREVIKEHFHDLNAKGKENQDRKQAAVSKEMALPVQIPLDRFLAPPPAEVHIDFRTLGVAVA